MKRILDSKTFDNGTICASEQSIVVERRMEGAVTAELKAQGAYLLDDEEHRLLSKFILRPNGTMNPAIVGKSVETVAKLAGLTRVPPTARVLVARETGVGAVNMDLIAGLPLDSLDGFRRSLDGVLAMGPENITVHTLAMKKGSRLMEEGGGLPSGAAVADMLDFAWAALRGAGQRPYYLYRQKYMSGSFENVGWCRPGAESLYNICMMEELHTIVSLGGGGVTKLVDRATGYIERLANAKYPQEYIQKIDAICADKGRVAQFYAAHGR